MIRIHPLVLLSLGLIACGRSPWAAPDAPKVPPDEQFRTGHDDLFRPVVIGDHQRQSFFGNTVSDFG